MSEMKTLTLNGKTYDSFVDKEAREAIENLEQNGITGDQIAEAVEDYFTENPIEIPEGGTVVQADWNAKEGKPGHVLNRTHYTEHKKEYLAENVTFTKTANMQSFTWITYLKVENLEKVYVVFDGVEYVCPVKVVIDSQNGLDESYFSIGNTFVNNSPEYPFGLFGYKGNDFTLVYAEEGEHNISVYCDGEEIVHKLDPKYLPEVVTDEQVASAVEDYMAENPVIPGATVEPAEEDIPKVFFGGALQQTKDEKVVPFRYISKTQDFSGYAEIKAQGNSSMNYAKKNQTVKLFKDADCTEKLKVDFKGWGKQNKHVYKANWIDLTHARNIVSARIWGDVVKSRSNYAELPELFRTTPNQGAVDGFPVKVYAAGVYQGRYTLNIPKDKWTFNMDDELNEHCVLCGENYVSGCFRAAAKINESDWTDEIHDTVPTSIKTRWNEVISFVMNSTDEEFKANIGNYFFVDSLIDYHLFGLISCGLDAYGKNQIYATYDGQKWIASMYDMDSTWGLWWTGASFVATDYDRSEYQDFNDGEGNLLYIRLEQLFHSELQARWAELKNGALSIENIINRFERFTDIAPAELVAEDYASTTGGGKFTNIPSKTTNNIQQLRSFALARWTWVDEYVNALVPVPCTGISLDAETLTFTAAGTQTLTATVTPDGCTDPVTWESNNTSVAIVADGVVTAIANGSATITAKCGAYSASCAVSVSGIESGGGESGGGEDDVTPVYSLAEPTTFNGTSDFVDTGVKLYDTEKDWTIILAADFTQNTKLSANALHCVKEERPWPGVCVYLNRLTDDPATSVYDVGGNAGAGAGQAYLTNMPATATKLAIRCTGGKIDKAAYINEGKITSNTPANVTYTAYDGNLLLGCYQDTSGKKDRFWQGTISQCDVYFAALSDAKIETLLN